MAQQNEDHLSGLERHTQHLSDTVEKLRASLFTFQRWYLDYLDLKEEVDAVPRSAADTTTTSAQLSASHPPPAGVATAPSESKSESKSKSTPTSTAPTPTPTATRSSSKNDGDGIGDGNDPPTTRAGLARIRRDFQGALITRADVADIFGPDIDQLYSLARISGALGRRIDYVERNVATLERMVAQAEHKLAAARVVASPDFGNADDGGNLPITDIVETLDEDGNVLDFRLQTGGNAARTIREVLGTAGVEGLLEEGQEAEDGGDDGLVQEKKAPASGSGATTSQPDAKIPASISGSTEHPGLKKTVSFSGDTKPGHELKNKVSFSADTRPGHQPKKKVSFSQDTKPVRNQATRQDGPSSDVRINERLAKLMEEARRQEAMNLSTAGAPENESAEDRELRRQMVEYGMSEIGPVVAELTIEDGDATDGSDADDMGWDDDGDMDRDDSYDDTDEDETGRSKSSVLTSAYVKRMQELEKRLAVQPAFSAAPPRQPPAPELLSRTQTGSGTLPGAGLAAEKLAPAPGTARPVTSTLSDGGSKKAVRFDTQGPDLAEEKVSSSAKPEPGSRSAAANKIERSTPHPAISPHGDVLERASASSKPLPPQQRQQQKADVSEETQAPKRVSRFKKGHTKENGRPSSQQRPFPTAAAAAIATGPATRGPVEMAAILATRGAAATSSAAAGAGAAPPDPTGPEGRTLADTVVERAVAAMPRNPDDPDDMLLVHAAAVEYNALRNRMIQSEGGFARRLGGEEEEQEKVAIHRRSQAGGEEEDEEEEGQGQLRPMSRFKAARLARGL